MLKKTESDYKNYIYPVTTTIWSQKKNLEARKFQLISNVTRPSWKNSEKLIRNQVLQNKDWLRAVQSPSHLPLSSKDEDIEENVIMKDNSSYGI